MEKNAKIFKRKGKDNKYYLFAEIHLNNGIVVTLPIRQSFYNSKLNYKIIANIDTNED